MAVQHFIEELKRRRVFRVATLYIVSFWPVVQIADILSPALELPDSVMRYLVIAFAAGFPVALILAWIFDVNRDGVSVTRDESDEAVARPLIGGRSEFKIIAALLVLVAVLFVVQLSMGPELSTTQAEQRLLTPVTAQPAAAIAKSVAVLPFVTFSSDPQDEQFADGLTEELLNVLSKVKSLRVAARTSTFAYRGVNKDVTEIGRELRVGTILEGSVRRNDVDDTIRVTAQLIDATTGSHIWSKTYDRQFSDLFAIQDDIASSVVEELQITLLGEDRQRVLSQRRTSPEALAAYGIAQAELARRTEQSLSDAIRFYERAATLDPEGADYYVGIATAHTLKVSYGYASDIEGELRAAEAAVSQALALEPESGGAWATRGLIHMQRKDNEAAMDALEKAMAFNPNHAPAVMWYAGLQRNIDERLALYQRAYELDPRSPIIGYNVATILFARGDIAGAMKIYGEMLAADPNYHGAYHLAGRIAESRGRIDEAINQYTRAWELSGSDQYVMSLAQLYTDLGDFEKSQEWLARLDDRGIPGFRVLIDWLQVASLASAGRPEEYEPLLRDKIAAAATFGDDLHYEDATVAAFYLGRPEDVIRNFELIRSEATVEHFENSNRIDAMFSAAHSYQQQGKPARAELIVSELTRLLAELEEKSGNMHYSYWQNQARLAVLTGEPRLALVHLQRAVDEGLRSHWALSLDPIFASLNDNPAFHGLIAGLETRMSIMREQLAIASSFDSDWSG